MDSGGSAPDVAQGEEIAQRFRHFLAFTMRCSAWIQKRTNCLPVSASTGRFVLGAPVDAGVDVPGLAQVLHGYALDASGPAGASDSQAGSRASAISRQSRGRRPSRTRPLPRAPTICRQLVCEACRSRKAPITVREPSLTRCEATSFPMAVTMSGMCSVAKERSRRYRRRTAESSAWCIGPYS